MHAQKMQNQSNQSIMPICSNAMPHVLCLIGFVLGLAQFTCLLINIQEVAMDWSEKKPALYSFLVTFAVCLPMLFHVLVDTISHYFSSASKKNLFLINRSFMLLSVAVPALVVVALEGNVINDEFFTKLCISCIVAQRIFLSGPALSFLFAFKTKVFTMKRSMFYLCVWGHLSFD